VKVEEIRIQMFQGIEWEWTIYGGYTTLLDRKMGTKSKIWIQGGAIRCGNR